MNRTTGYDPRWDIDLGFGTDGETRVADLLGLTGATVEVKHDRHLDSANLFLETHRQDAYGYWTPSGLSTSEADYWAYRVGETTLIVATAHLRLALSILKDDVRTVDVNYGIPTRGVLMPRVLLQQVRNV